MTLTPNRLTRQDWFLLVGASLIVFAIAGFSGRSITTHESVHCQNVREMLTDGDWIIPHYGGRVWLERPPLPHWMTAVVIAATGQVGAEWPYRLSAALAGAFMAGLIGWIGSVWYGRGIGLLAGLTFTTTRIGFGYATGAEADIFLAAVVTSVTALFVKAEFVRPRDPQASSFFGSRGWEVLALFILLGLTNTAKGLFFGMILAGLPLAGFVLGQWSWTAARRYVWFWGWLAFGIAATAWPIAAYLREPGVLDLWKSDYIGRLNQGYMREPMWYYIANLPWSIFPWTITAIVGFVAAGRGARNPASPDRFLLCWAILPVAFLSIPQGKHHHYLLPAIGAWCVFSAVAAERVWAWLREYPAWMRHPAFSASLTAIVCGVGVFYFRARIQASDAAIAALIGIAIVSTAAFRWALDHPQKRIAAAGTCAFTAFAYVLFEFGTAAYGDSYTADRALVSEVESRVPANETLYVVNDPSPLESSWMLFYRPENTKLLHNLSFLLADDIKEREVWVLGRGYGILGMEQYGSVETVATSSRSRTLSQEPLERWTLCKVALKPDRPRVRADSVRINPMQATGRAAGPFLVPAPAFAAR